jgi:DNA-binding MarR family transcriptional regulator
MTGLVDRMEKKGLVRRVPHRRDRRSIELEVTPAGTLVLQEQWRGLEAVARGLLEAMPKADQHALITILRRIHDTIEHGGAQQAG